MGTKNGKPKTVYAIQCTTTDRVYVGCCTDVQARIAQHFYDLERGIKTMYISKHERGNTPWQDDFNTHGRDKFKAYILECNIPEGEAPAVELKYILQYRANEPEFGYNIRPAVKPAVEILEGAPPLPPAKEAGQKGGSPYGKNPIAQRIHAGCGIGLKDGHGYCASLRHNAS